MVNSGHYVGYSQCQKPTMTGDGFSTRKNGDDLGVVSEIGFTTYLDNFLLYISSGKLTQLLNITTFKG